MLSGRTEESSMESASGPTGTNDRKRFRNWKRHQRRREKRAEEEIVESGGGVKTGRDEHQPAIPDQKSKPAKDDIYPTRATENFRQKLIRQVCSRLEHLDHLELLRAQAESNTNSVERNPSQSALFHETVGRLRTRLKSFKGTLEALNVETSPPKPSDQAEALFGGRRNFSFRSIDELVANREEWDAYADEQGQTIPVKWVVPGGSEPEWLLYKCAS